MNPALKFLMIGLFMTYTCISSGQSRESMFIKKAKPEAISSNAFQLSLHIGSARANQVFLVRGLGDSIKAPLQLKTYDETKAICIDSVFLPQGKNKIRNLIQVDSTILFHGCYNVSDSLNAYDLDEFILNDYVFNYQDIWVSAPNTKPIKLTTINEHYLDRDIFYALDSKAQFVTTTTFVPEYLRSTIADSIIYITRLSTDNRRPPQTIEYWCTECIRPQVVNDYLYFGKKSQYLKGTDNYDWNIYRVPLSNLSTVELIAEYAEPLVFNTNGSLLLASKTLFGRKVPVIIDIERKRAEYLYFQFPVSSSAFYSKIYEAFALNLPNEIVYLNTPKQFPLRSVGTDFQIRSGTRKENDKFWAQIR